MVHRLDAERAPLPLSEVAKALLVCNNRFGSKLEDERHHNFGRNFQPIFDLSLQPFNRGIRTIDMNASKPRDGAAALMALAMNASKLRVKSAKY